MARFDRHLIENVTWARHNLITDASFNEFHIILCANVLTYFSPPLQERVHSLLYESLSPSGFLVLGRLEPMARWKKRTSYKRVADSVYRKGPR
jgi:chemotaxis protein methyltransferase CheR